jgi:hypothetical protein
VRGFVIGLALLVFLTVTILSFRPGGLRRQLRFAARRLRLGLILGGVYVVVTTVVRIAFPDGWVMDWSPPVLAVGLAIAYLLLAQDPSAPTGSARDGTSRS